MSPNCELPAFCRENEPLILFDCRISFSKPASLKQNRKTGHIFQGIWLIFIQQLMILHPDLPRKAAYINPFIPSISRSSISKKGLTEQEK